MTNNINDLPLLEAKGSLELRGDVDEGEFWVCFSYWSDHSGSGSLAAVSDWKEIYCNTMRREVKLNGSQAVTVDRWAEEYG